MARNEDSFRLDPIRLGALIGAVAAFVAVGAIIDVLWVVAGAVVGGAVGYGVRRLARGARTYAEAVDLEEDSTRADLYRQAQELDVQGRSSMDRAELAAAIAERRNA